MFDGLRNMIYSVNIIIIIIIIIIICVESYQDSFGNKKNCL